MQQLELHAARSLKTHLRESLTAALADIARDIADQVAEDTSTQVRDVVSRGGWRDRAFARAVVEAALSRVLGGGRWEIAAANQARSTPLIEVCFLLKSLFKLAGDR